MKNHKRIKKLYKLFDHLIECGDFESAHKVLALIGDLWSLQASANLSNVCCGPGVPITVPY